MKKCWLCFNNFSDENGLGHNPKVLELCCKYLHSAFALVNLSNQPLFCSKCLESAIQLGCFCEQLDILQKSISELIFTFSLEILHRRGKRSDYETQTNEMSGKRLIQFDVSAFPDCNTWNISIDNSDVPGSTARNSGSVTPENVYVGNVETEDLFDFSSLVGIGNEVEVIKIEEIRNETNWIDESIYLGQEEIYATEFPTEIENAQEHLTSNQGNPIIKLKRLKFYGKGRKSVAVESDVKWDNNQKGRISTNIWSKKTPGGSYIIQNSGLLSCEQGVGSSPTLGYDSIDEKVLTATSSVYKDQIPASQASEITANSFQRSQNRSPRSKKFKQNAGKSSIRCNLCHKKFTTTHSLRRHHLIHSGELPFKCDICNQKFRHKHHLKAHKLMHTGESFVRCPHCPNTFDGSLRFNLHLQKHHPDLLPFQCPTCGKGYSMQRNFHKHMKTHKQKMYFKCRDCEKCCRTSEEVEKHYKSVHFGLDFAEDCIIKLKK